MSSAPSQPRRDRGGGGRAKPKPADGGVSAAAAADSALPVGRRALDAIRDATGQDALTDEEILLALDAAGGDVNEATARLIESELERALAPAPASAQERIGGATLAPGPRTLLNLGSPRRPRRACDI